MATPSFQIIRDGTPEGNFQVEHITPVFVVCAGNSIFVSEHAPSEALRQDARQVLARYREIVAAFGTTSREGAYLTAAHLFAVRYAEGLTAARNLLNTGVSKAGEIRDAAVKGMFLSKVFFRLVMVILKALVAGGLAWLVIHIAIPESVIAKLPLGVDRDVLSKLTGIGFGLLSFLFFNWLSRRRVSRINEAYDQSCQSAIDEYCRRLNGEFDLCSRAAQDAWERLTGRRYLEGDALRAVVKGTMVKELLSAKHGV